MSGGKPDLATVAALSSVLDRIDATNTAQPPRLKELSAAIHSPIPSTALEQTPSAEYIPPTSVVTATGTPVNVWLEYFDPASKRNYYHNLETKETTWDKPAIFVPASTAQSSSTRLSSGDEYRFAGAFNTQSGRFTAVKPHLFDAVSPLSLLHPHCLHERRRRLLVEHWSGCRPLRAPARPLRRSAGTRA